LEPIIHFTPPPDDYASISYLQKFTFEIYHHQQNHMYDLLITTSTNLEGYRIKSQLGLVRGITVRSRSILGNMAGGFMSIFGGRNTIYTELCENSREEALQLMIQHAHEMGANAIINMRYESNEVMAGLTEVLAYGTAVEVEKL
jgi:uncharacterized protein YbjQ (UPF0145 family)